MTTKCNETENAAVNGQESSTVFSVLTTLIDRLDSRTAIETGVVPWGCPVPTFGDLSNPRVATLGINPSYREFVDGSGKELRGELRRFHTLDSLGIETWGDADLRHLKLIMDTYRSYFLWNPYDLWFKKLDFVISGAGVSYYDPSSSACHIDLVPFATVRRWGDLSGQQRSSLLALAGNTVGIILRDSPVRTLILNGNSVVRVFQSITDVSLGAEEIPAWSLRRQSRGSVKGIAYTGAVDTVAGVKLDRRIGILGFNHNIQSSFGVSRYVISAIRDWVAKLVEEIKW